MTGFEDGVVRLLELFDPRKLHLLTGRSSKRDAELRLKQAFKPHNAPVTAAAYERNGEILATGVRFVQKCNFFGKLTHFEGSVSQNEVPVPSVLQMAQCPLLLNVKSLH